MQRERSSLGLGLERFIDSLRANAVYILINGDI